MTIEQQIRNNITRWNMHKRDAENYRNAAARSIVQYSIPRNKYQAWMLEAGFTLSYAISESYRVDRITRLASDDIKTRFLDGNLTVKQASKLLQNKQPKEETVEECYISTISKLKVLADNLGLSKEATFDFWDVIDED